MIKLWIIVPLAMFLIAACGGSAEPTVAPVPTEIPTPPPTATPSPTQTPWIITEYIEVPVTPSFDTPGVNEAIGDEQGQDAQEEEQVNPTPTITPVPVPTPLPTPRWRPAKNPVGEATFAGFKISGAPTFSGDIFTMSAVIDVQGISPTQVQIWQSLRLGDLGGKCSTDKPIALLSNSQTGGSSSIQWEYCQFLGQEPLIYVDSVPWVTNSWNYTERPRRRTTTPYLADWSVTANLDTPLVNDLTYNSPVGYTVVVFAGERLMARVWVDN